MTRRVVIGYVGQTVAHAVVCDHGVSHLGGTLKVVESTGVSKPKEHLLCHTTGKQRAYLVEQSLLWLYLAFFGHIPCGAQSLATRHYRDLYERVGIAQVPAHGGVSGLVHSYGAAFLVGHYLGAFFQSTHYAVNGVAEVLALHRLFVVARGNQGSLVAHIGYVGSREAWRLTRKQVNVNTAINLHLAQMHLKDFFTVAQFRQIHIDLTVETAGTQQSLVENVGTVGGGENYHATVAAKTVHLGEQLVERVFTLVV